MTDEILRDTEKAYNLARSELFNLAAYGHSQYWPSGYALRTDDDDQRKRYCELIHEATKRFEAAAIRKAAADYERREARRHPGLVYGPVRRIRATKVGFELRRMADNL